jgi:SAM-dependent methyltransferase
MTDMDRGQVSGSAAEIYETFFVPALFAQWAVRVADAARIGAGERVLDVACGTGVLARTARERVGARGTVVGLDMNPAMLAVAHRAGANIEWREARAEALPFDSGSFDVVVSQFGLMFFQDRTAALAEMLRVLRSGGRLAVAVWDTLENTPGYAVVTRLLERLFGAEVADALRAPYALGDRARLIETFRAAGVSDPTLVTAAGTARFASISAWMHTDVRGWTLADRIDEGAFRTLLVHAETELRQFADAQGRVSFPAPAHIVTAVKR